MDNNMGNIRLVRNQLWNSTIIPNYFLDELMPDANGEFVKVYLYLLRWTSTPGSDLSISRIADTFNHTEKDIIRALRYWEQTGLLTLEYDNSKNLTGIRFNEWMNQAEESAVTAVSSTVNSESQVVKESAESPVPTDIIAAQDTTAPEKHHYTVQEITAFTSKEEISQLLYITQKYLGKTLSPTETNTILYFYDTLNFSVELIEYLIEYCVSKDHKSLRYIEKVALSWASENITSVAQAKESTTIYNKNCFAVMKAFGISGRNPGESERSYITKWVDSYHFTIDIIIEACNRTIQTIHQPSFEYTDSILTKWQKKGIRHISDIKTLDLEHDRTKEAKASQAVKKSAVQNRFNNFQARSYSYGDLEQKLLNKN